MKQKHEIQNSAWCAGERSISEVFALYAVGTECDSPESLFKQKLGMAACTHNPKFGEIQTGRDL